LSIQLGTSWLVASPPPPQSSQLFDVPSSTDEEAERAPFINAASDDARSPLETDKVDSLSVKEVLKSTDPTISRPLKALVAVMLCQQLSGINAVMFYSVT
jgi:hypothetical protein